MRPSIQGIQRRLLVAAAFGALIAAGPGHAQQAPRQTYRIEAQGLAEALREVSRISGKEIMFPSDAVQGRRAPAVAGSFTLDEAVDRLLAGSGLVAEYRDGAVLIRGRARPSGEAVDRSTGPADIVVTGSRIKGAPPTSPVTVLSAEAMRTAGYHDLGEAIRGLPQNFSGGQNPGVTISASGTNQNVTSGSSLNLRGLGADASLTLLNGHRMAYDSSTQAIDISAIPLAAVERVEIVADGASALYGSDAVGGVANIILKKDFDGIDTSARFGAATDGGFVQQQYSLVAGRTWSSGGLLAAVDYQHSTEISARQRSYTAAVPDDTTLYPGQDYVGLIATGHQQLGALSFDMDGFYSRRSSPVFAAFDPAGYAHDGALLYSRTEAIGISPRVSLGLGHGWRGELRGTYGLERDYLRTDYYFGSALYYTAPTRFDNRLGVLEASGEGGLIRLPAGMARLAIGGGYRSVGLRGDEKLIYAGSGQTSTLIFDRSRNAYYGYAELFVPLVSARQNVPAIEKLFLTAAGRFERYDSFGSVFTPKLGLVYSPISAIDIKGSWGRSFKAPTLSQTSIPSSAVLMRASNYAAGYPASAAVLYSDGGNPDLQAEHASTWTATLSLHPDFFGGARFEASYFHVSYRDRVLSPLTSPAGALTSPLYQDLVTLNPSTAQIDAVIGRSAQGLTNNTSFPFAYANVIAIVDNRYRNIASYEAQGVDFSASIPVDLGRSGKLLATASISYIESSQRTTPRSPAATRAGTIGYPPHWRMHAGLTWTSGGLTLAPALDYIGDVTDTRTAVARKVGSMTTFDLTARYKLGGGDGPRGLELSLSILNAFNAKPAPIAVPAFFYPAYDSANYSAIGRAVSFTIARRW